MAVRNLRSRLETTWPRASPGATRSGIALGLLPSRPVLLGPCRLEGPVQGSCPGPGRANGAPGQVGRSDQLRGVRWPWYVTAQSTSRHGGPSCPRCPGSARCCVATTLAERHARAFLLIDLPGPHTDRPPTRRHCEPGAAAWQQPRRGPLAVQLPPSRSCGRLSPLAARRSVGRPRPDTDGPLALRACSR